MNLLLARLEPGTRQLSYTSAGHSGCAVNRFGAIRTTLRSTGFPLGLVADAKFHCAKPIDLEPGDVVLLTTDGITEAHSPDGILFGLERAIDLVRIYQNRSAFDIVNNLFHAVRAFTQICPQDDDITTVVIKVNDISASAEKDSHS
jgi:sigma-B regulation protein RsbU (phosphoserine phosphatase)